MIRFLFALAAVALGLQMAPAMARGIVIDGTIDICGVQEFYGPLDANGNTEVNIGTFDADDGLGDFGTTCDALTHPNTTFDSFSINFFGVMYDSFYFNENGIITFGAPLTQPVGTSLQDLAVPAIAPFFADGMTTSVTDPQFGWASDFVEDQFWLTWFNFQEDGSSSGERNAFQLAIVDQGNGDFDLILNYDRIEWDPAQVGFTDGNGNGFLFDGALTDGGYTGFDDPAFPPDCTPTSLACNMLNDGLGLGAIDFDNNTNPDGELRSGYYRITFRDGVPTNLDLNFEVPLPAAFWMFLAGALSLSGASRLRQRKN